MRKLTLSLETLAIESFDTLGGPRAGERGTVHGRSAVPMYGTGADTDVATCGAVNTCGYYYEGCMETYAGSCWPCDVSAACISGFSCRESGCAVSTYDSYNVS